MTDSNDSASSHTQLQATLYIQHTYLHFVASNKLYFVNQERLLQALRKKLSHEKHLENAKITMGCLSAHLAELIV